jgi:NAD(P)-dependent dehydrogenase (short-subunit alcohol dehydrogenase family)
MKATLYTLQAAHGQMAQAGGSVVVIGGSFSLAGAAQLIPFSTAIEGQRGLVKSTARQWGKSGITVNWIAAAAKGLSERFADVKLPFKGDYGAGGVRPHARPGARDRAGGRVPRQLRRAGDDRRHLAAGWRRLDGALTETRMNTNTSLAGRTAIVTGAGGGIGRGLALALAAAGANVVIAARRAVTGDETLALVRQEGGSAISVQADVGVRADIDRAVAAAVESFGGLDIVCTTHRAASPARPSSWRRSTTRAGTSSTPRHSTRRSTSRRLRSST